MLTFGFSIVFPLLFMTLSEENCNSFLGCDSAVENHSTRVYTVSDTLRTHWMEMVRCKETYNVMLHCATKCSGICDFVVDIEKWEFQTCKTICYFRTPMYCSLLDFILAQVFTLIAVHQVLSQTVSALNVSFSNVSERNS